MNYFNEGNKYYNQKEYKRALYYYKKSIVKNKMKHAPTIIQEYAS